MEKICKSFGANNVLTDVSFRLEAGEICALLGENGAGKSTLMSVLFGLYQPEEGEIRKDGKKVQINNPNDANALGIGMVHQHFKLVECFSVLENIILGVEDTKNGILQTARAREKVVALSEKYGLQVDPDALANAFRLRHLSELPACGRNGLWRCYAGQRCLYRCTAGVRTSPGVPIFPHGRLFPHNGESRKHLDVGTEPLCGQSGPTALYTIVVSQRRLYPHNLCN